MASIRRLRPLLLPHYIVNTLLVHALLVHALLATSSTFTQIQRAGRYLMASTLRTDLCR